jgi:hypothetical protein
MKSGKTLARIIGLSAVFVALIALAFPSVTVTGGLARLRAAEDGGKTCTLGTVEGSYGVVFSGTLLGVGPVTATGIVEVDGKGGLSYNFTENTYGTVSSAVVTGTYTLGSDCTTTVTIPGVTYAGVVVHHGAEIDLQSTSSFLVGTAVVKRLWQGPDRRQGAEEAVACLPS